MIEKIKMVKGKVLDFMDQEVGKYGNGRMDVKQVGELADVVKDLAMAEYYCTTAEAMSGSAGYSGGSMGYSGGGNTGSMGYSGGGRSGYSGGNGMMGHSDPMSVLREMLANADPEKRMQIRNEIMNM